MLARLEKERGFICCDINELIDHEIERGTRLGIKMMAHGAAVPNIYKIELIEKIMFNEPANTRFVFTNFPDSEKAFFEFERDLYPVDYLI